jgi:Domain of unknown function (DUF4124)
VWVNFRKEKIMKNRFLFVIALLVMSFSVSADIYKWVDSNGKVHYSNTPPPDVKGAKVKVEDPAPPTGPATPPATAEYWRKKDEEFRQRRDELNKVEKEKTDKVAMDDAEKRKKSCEFYKRDLENVSSKFRHLTRSADGTEIIEDPNGQFLNKGQRGAAIGELTELIEKTCN